jgi:predicted DCC family thiol-disulfide oxidoreductase YuxK
MRAEDRVLETKTPPSRPTMVYDGECAFCTRWAKRWQLQIGDGIDFEPSSSAAARFPDVPRDQLDEAIHLFEPDGRVLTGAGAVFRALASRKDHRAHVLLALVYAGSPGFARLAELVYRTVTHHRVAAARLSNLLVGKDVRPATWTLGSWLFLRLLGLSSLAAFGSFGVQAKGLVGEHGIAPVRELLAAVRAQGLAEGASTLEIARRAPTLLWAAPTDTGLTVVCAAGAVTSLLLLFDVVPGVALVLVWALYLSLTTVGDVFLGYQWDALLLETCVAAAFVVPWTRGLGRRTTGLHPPRAIGLWVVRLLLFKLVFLSGAVKRLSRDPSWSDLSALRYHWFTQPLPTWTSWYASQLPRWFDEACVLVTFAVELWLPLLVFVPGRARRLAFWGFLLLQVTIAATGNFGFFNLLTIALACVLLDDAAIAGLVPARLRPRLEPLRDAALAVPRRRFGVATILASIVLAASALRMQSAVSSDPSATPRPIARAFAYVAPFASLNAYGLFAVMTTTRREISVEGSDDGVIWRAYRFRWKPGDDLAAPPRFATPHMPRLDWQMWFASLGGTCAGERWYLAFVQRLLEGSPEVLALLADNPFRERPPRFVRSVTWDYRFTTLAEKRATGAWWKREPGEPYCPTLTMRKGRLDLAE